MIRKKQIKMIKSALMFAVFVAFTLTATAAFAKVSYIKPHDVTRKVKIAEISEIQPRIAKESKARAPEPSSLAVFGGGFIGMLLSFVRRTYAFAKRVFDMCAGIVGIILSFPIMLVAAILVKATSKGPIVYSQIRVGKGGRNFKMYKFRTMKVDAEQNTGPVWAAKNDTRITPIGLFLRKTRIDELPQFFNVLRGEMSLIGPRPERPSFVDKFKEEITGYEKRLEVKPGITGLAQVFHRYDETIEDVKKKLKYDLLYIRKMDFWSDFRIFFRTFGVILTGSGAR